MGHKGPVNKGLRASEPKGPEPIYYSLLFNSITGSKGLYFSQKERK